MSKTKLKSIGLDEGKVNRGIVTWLVILVISGLIGLEKQSLSWIIYIYAGASFVIVVCLIGYNLLKKKPSPYTRALSRFFSEFGGGF